MMHSGPLTSTKLRGSKVGVDDGGVDVGEDLELVGAAHVVAVARGAEADRLLPRLRLAHHAGLEGAIMPCSTAMRRIQRSGLMLTGRFAFLQRLRRGDDGPGF